MNLTARLALELALLSFAAFVLWALRRSNVQRSLRLLAAVGAAAVLSGTGYALAIFGGWTPVGRAADTVSRSPQFFFTTQLITTTVFFVIVALLKRKETTRTAGPGTSRA